jgi:hypothetical protein
VEGNDVTTLYGDWFWKWLKEELGTFGRVYSKF